MWLFLFWLFRKIDQSIIPDEVLLAPSWNYDEKNFINEDFDLIIEHLIENNLKVRFRPHPEHLKRSSKFINYLKDKYLSKNFIFDNEIENYNSMEKAKCLITDNSGIAIEYILILKKPVFYFESRYKIHNKDLSKFKDMFNLEEYIKKEFGYIFNKTQIENIKELINYNLKNFNNEKLLRIDDFLKKKFYNFNNTSKFLDINIKNIID